MATKRKPTARKPGRPRAPEIEERRRTDLLEAAFRLIAERGLEGLRTREIAKLAGANIATLHYYFGTKEALVAGVVQYASQKFAERDPQHDGSGDGSREESLHEHLASAQRAFEATPHLTKVMQELAVRAQRDAATRKAFHAVFAGWSAVLEEIVRRDAVRGAVRRDVDAPAAARIVTSFIIGALLQLGIDRHAFDLGQLAAELERWLRPTRAR